MQQPNRKPLASAIHLSLMASATAGLALASSPVFAQDGGEADESAQLDRVQVTGSRISRVDIEGANPVTVLDREDIKRTGITDLGELLQDLPMMNGSPISSQRNNGGNGRVAVDIRGLGTQRTLVLVNGNRLPSVFNDISVIPVAMVERVEILKDGASAIYGADAVAGVVNIITRRDFEGAEFEVQIGESFDQGGKNTQVSFITGGNTDRGNFVVGVEYTEQDPVFLAAYDQFYIRQAVTIYDGDEFAQFGLQPPGMDLDGDGIYGVVSFGSSRIPFGRFDLSNAGRGGSETICQGNTGSSPDDYGTRGGTCGPATYDFAPVNYMQTPFERTGFFFQGDYELFDNVNAYMEGRFSSRESEQLLAPLPYDTRFDPSYAQVEPGVAISKDNFYNPFGVDIPQWRRRMVETGGRSFNQEVSQWQIVVGLQGDLGATWSWDVSYNYGSRTRVDTDFGQFNGNNLANALGPSFMDANGNVVCGTPDAPIDGCVSLNAFTNPVNNPITPEMLAYVSVPLNDRFDTTRQVFNATIVGDLVELPAGPMAGAFGFERRSEDFRFIPDSAKTTGQTTGNTGLGTFGNYDVDSFFAELVIPLLSGAPGAELLELNLSGRYDDFSTFGSNNTFQAGLRWQPVRSVLLRATVGEVFREPNISELFAGSFDSFPNTVDPCSGRGGQAGCEDTPPGYVQSDTQARGRVSGNANITPEEGDTFTVGFAWSPEFLDGFSMTLDYWEVEIDDAINTPSNNVVLAGCYADRLAGTNSGACDAVTRFPLTDPVDPGALDFVFTPVQKVGPETAKGLDFSFNYSLNTDIGLWRFGWQGTYNLEREQLVLKDFDRDGVYDRASADVIGLFEHRGLGRPKAFPELRHRFDVDWSLGDWGMSLSAEFIDEVTECGNPNADNTFLTQFCEDDPQPYFTPPLTPNFRPAVETYTNTVDSVWYFDLVGRYTVPNWGTQIAVGITNLTDEELPFLNQGPNATTDEDTFRAFGRSWFVNLKHSF